MFNTRGMITSVNIGAKNIFGTIALATGNFIRSNKKVAAEAKLKDRMLITIEMDRNVSGALLRVK